MKKPDDTKPTLPTKPDDEEPGTWYGMKWNIDEFGTLTVSGTKESNVADGSDTAIKEFYVPFSFENNADNSEFQIIEILGDFEYKYGFEYNAKSIVTEWLYRKNLKTNRTAIIFERTAERAGFGASVRKECDVYKEQILVETLALSFFNKLKLQTDIFRVVFLELWTR